MAVSIAMGRCRKHCASSYGVWGVKDGATTINPSTWVIAHMSHPTNLSCAQARAHAWEEASPKWPSP